jgi:predicted ATP-dependent protease
MRAVFDPTRIPYADSRDIPANAGPLPFQPRALQALRLALTIKGGEYNVFVAGEANLGRTYFVKNFLAPIVEKLQRPPDWVFLHNFEDPDRPAAVSLPAGQGRELKTGLAKAVAEVRRQIPARLAQEAHVKKHESLIRRYQTERDKLLSRMEDMAGRQGFNLEMDEQGALILTPVLEGKTVSQEEFDRLAPDVRKRFKAQGDALLSRMTTLLRRMNRKEDGLRKDELSLHRATAESVLAACLDPLATRFRPVKRLAAHLKALRQDLLENIDLFLPKDPPPPGQSPSAAPPDPHAADEVFWRYEVNLFVDNGKTVGAPVVQEDHPTHFNLLGCIERETEMGALYTDFRLIKAGAMHKANHGFLILNLEDVMSNPQSWEGLLRALRTGRSRIEDPGDPDQVRAKTIEPEPVPLSVRVILVGTDEMYEALLYGDERFAKYFKLKAHLQASAERTPANVKRFLQALAQIIAEAGLLPFDREALAGLLELSCRLSEDQGKLSLHFPLVRERMIEADALARMGGQKVVDKDLLLHAVRSRDFRSNLFEAEFMTDYDREVIKVATGGEAVGRANGLSVTLFGDYEFGLPHQISCTVGVGHGGILDLEREAQLGGPIHTKGMMIIKGYLLGRFAQDKPIVLTGNLCFEQSYAGVEGDSASGAELAALLSALARVPINLSYAFTGAVSQSGAIMAVGGVSRKIEGFFEVCRRRGLTGKQGVLIPKDNVDNLMLKPEILVAVESGDFCLHPVESIEEAMFILTGMPAGRRGKSGRFPRNTLFHLVDERLAELGRLAQISDKKGRRR